MQFINILEKTSYSLLSSFCLVLSNRMNPVSNLISTQHIAVTDLSKSYAPQDSINVSNITIYYHRSIRKTKLLTDKD